MDLQEKYRLVEKIILTKDDEILNEVKALLGLATDDFWNHVPNNVKDEIQVAENQLNQAEGIPHSTIMA